MVLRPKKLHVSDPKQVIVLRKDLNMRKGKMCAQAAHASLVALLNLGVTHEQDHDVLTGYCESNLVIPLNHLALNLWLKGSYKKITVSVNSEAELLETYERAKGAGLICSLILDHGLTEFGGVMTYTAVAIGPAFPSEVDPITSHLQLL